MDRQSSPVKIMFQILQCLHHLVMIQDDANTAVPRQAFFQKAKELDRVVRPAMPTPDLADKIKSINLAWAFEIRSTLVTHYRKQLDFLSGSLKAWNLSATDCVHAKLKAKEWANATLAENWNPKHFKNSTAESNKFSPHPNQPKPKTRTDPNEFLAGRSLLTLLMCSLFLQTSPAPMLTDWPCQPQGHQELTKPIPRLQNHPLQSPEHLSPNLPVSQKH